LWKGLWGKFTNDSVGKTIFLCGSSWIWNAYLLNNSFWTFYKTVYSAPCPTCWLESYSHVIYKFVINIMYVYQSVEESFSEYRTCCEGKWHQNFKKDKNFTPKQYQTKFTSVVLDPDGVPRLWDYPQFYDPIRWISPIKSNRTLILRTVNEQLTFNKFHQITQRKQKFLDWWRYRTSNKLSCLNTHSLSDYAYQWANNF
jgi:hypothetical protein